MSMKYRVFFNQDCLMYGVAFHDKRVHSRWQVLPPRKCGARNGASAYTFYKKVAERWASELNKGGL